MMRQNYNGQVPAENFLDRREIITDRKESFTDGTKGQNNQVPDPGSEAVRIPSATSGRMPILT
jgi:hypothetical protein